MYSLVLYIYIFIFRMFHIAHCLYYTCWLKLFICLTDTEKAIEPLADVEATIQKDRRQRTVHFWKREVLLPGQNGTMCVSKHSDNLWKWWGLWVHCFMGETFPVNEKNPDSHREWKKFSLASLCTEIILCRSTCYAEAKEFEGWSWMAV